MARVILPKIWHRATGRASPSCSKVGEHMIVSHLDGGSLRRMLCDCRFQLYVLWAVNSGVGGEAPAQRLDDVQVGQQTA